MHSYLPYFTASFITWTFIASVLGEASLTLVGAGNLIKSSQMPIVFHILRMLHRNLIVFLHNAIVLIAIWPFVRWSLYPSAKGSPLNHETARLGTHRNGQSWNCVKH
jgi:ABC-type polysaccharide/polyol phosphate export permease